jgi:hypothetical protein
MLSRPEVIRLVPSRRILRTSVVGATAAALGLAAGLPASAIWQRASSTFIDYRNVCRDGIRFGAAIQTGAVDDSAPFSSFAVGAQPAPVAWSLPTTTVMRVGMVFPLLDAPEDILVGQNQVSVAHRGSYTMKYAKGLLPSTTIALNVQDGDPQSSVLPATVGDCYLYAPIDVVPGYGSNPVSIGRGDVAVAVLGTSTMSAKKVTVRYFRFGPKKAAPKRYTYRDVNKDNRLDLVLTFGSVASGLTCATRSVRLTGKSPSGGVLEGGGRVTPVGCPT